MVVDEIDDKQVSAIAIPLLNETNTQKEINDKVLEANRKRTKAYKLEQEALDILDEKVIYAQQQAKTRQGAAPNLYSVALKKVYLKGNSPFDLLTETFHEVHFMVILLFQ